MQALRSPLERILKGALSGLRQFLATESPLKMMKNTFYFNQKRKPFKNDERYFLFHIKSSFRSQEI